MLQQAPPPKSLADASISMAHQLPPMTMQPMPQGAAPPNLGAGPPPPLMPRQPMQSPGPGGLTTPGMPINNQLIPPPLTALLHALMAKGK